MKTAIVALAVLSNTFGYAGIAWADLRAEVRVSVSGRDSQGNPLPPVFDSAVDLDPSNAATSEHVVIGNHHDLGTASAKAAAIATHGGDGLGKLAGLVINGQASLSRPSSPPFNGATGNLIASATAIIKYTDELILQQEPVFPGQIKVTGFYYLDGNLHVASARGGLSIGAEAVASVSISGTGMTSETFRARSTTSGVPDTLPTIGQIRIFSFQTSLGAPTPLSVDVNLTGFAEITGPSFTVAPAASAAAEFSANFFSTLSWGGITSVVRVSTGEPITDWTVTSTSGFDYSQFFPPVPEPCSFVLFLGGFLGLAMPRGRR